MYLGKYLTIIGVVAKNSAPILALAFLANLTHCAGEKTMGAPGPDETQISGVLAEATALAGQKVVIRNAAGSEVGGTTTALDGSFSIRVPIEGDLIIMGGEKNLSAVALGSEAQSQSRLIRNLNPVADAIYRRIHGDDLSQRSMSGAEAKKARQSFTNSALGIGFNIKGLLRGEFTAVQADDDLVRPSPLAVMVKTTIDVSKNRGAVGVKQMLEGIADNPQAVPFLEARDAQIELAANYILSGYNADETNSALGDLIDSSTDVAAAIKTSVNVISSAFEGVAGNSSLADKAAVFLAIQGVKGAMQYMVDFILSNGGNLTDDQLVTLVTNVANLAEEAIVNAFVTTGLQTQDELNNLTNLLAEASGYYLENLWDSGTILTEILDEGTKNENAGILENLTNQVRAAYEDQGDKNSALALGALLGYSATGHAEDLSLQQISDAGIENGQSGLLSAYRTAIENSGSLTDRNDLQALIDATNADYYLGLIQGYALSADATGLTIGQLTTAGVDPVVEDYLSDYKTAIEGAGSIVNLSALQSLINNVNESSALSVIQGYATGGDAGNLTIDQLQMAGISPVVTGFLSAYKSAIGGAGSIADQAALQSLISDVNADEMLIVIQGYATDGDASEMINAQLILAGVTDSDGTYIEDYRSAVAGAGSIADLAALQTLIDDVNTSLGI